MKMRGKRVTYLRGIGTKSGNVKHCHGWPECIDGCHGAQATRASEKKEFLVESKDQLIDESEE